MLIFLELVQFPLCLGSFRFRLMIFFLDNSLDNPNVQQLTAYLIHNYIDNSLSTVVVEGVRRASLYCCGALGFILQVFFFQFSFNMVIGYWACCPKNNIIFSFIDYNQVSVLMDRRSYVLLTTSKEDSSFLSIFLMSHQSISSIQYIYNFYYCLGNKKYWNLYYIG